MDELQRVWAVEYFDHRGNGGEATEVQECIREPTVVNLCDLSNLHVSLVAKKKGPVAGPCITRVSFGHSIHKY